MKKVAFLINSISPGGAERVVSRVSARLSKEYELYIFTIENTQQFYECSGKIICLGGNNKSYIVNVIVAIFNMRLSIRRYNIEYIISFLDVPNLLNCVFNSRLENYISIRGYNLPSENKKTSEKIKQRLCVKFYRKARKVIPVSRELGEAVSKIYNVDENKITVIENPYDVDEIQALSQSEIEKEIKEFCETHEVAIAIGRLEEEKGYDELLEAFYQVVSQNENAGLIVLGEGSRREQLEAEIKLKHLEKNVIILGNKKNPFAYMKRCKIYVSMSRREGFPNALVEAMACGLPAIHSDCRTGPREILTEKELKGINNNLFLEYGVLVPSYTRGDISREKMIAFFGDAWVTLLENNEMRDKYSHTSRQRAEFYNMSSCVNKYINIIG